MALIYWLVPEYKGQFYDSYHSTMLAVIVPAGLLLAIPYIWWG
jgi:hypothetical protein